MAAEYSGGKVQFEHLPNFRPVYSFPAKDFAVKTPKLFRSSRPDFLTMKEVEEYNSLGIKCIVDFRSVREYKKANGNKILDSYFPLYKLKLPFNLKYKPYEKVKLKPITVKTSNPVIVKHDNTDKSHILVDFFKINYIWAVFNRASLFVRLYSMLYLIMDLVLNTGFRYFVRCFARNVLNHSGLGGQYVDMVKYSQGPICAALKILCDENNLPAMINCAHGKDRTGIVSAMVLGILGKSKEEIAENYAISEKELEPIKTRVREEIVDRFHMHETFTHSLPDDIMEALDYIDNQYGSVPRYLESIGFSMAEQDKLKENLLQ